MIFGEHGQRLSVELDIFLLQASNQFTVRDTGSLGKRADADIPKGTEVTLLLLATAEHTRLGVE